MTFLSFSAQRGVCYRLIRMDSLKLLSSPRRISDDHLYVTLMSVNQNRRTIFTKICFFTLFLHPYFIRIKTNVEKYSLIKVSAYFIVSSTRKKWKSNSDCPSDYRHFFMKIFFCISVNASIPVLYKNKDKSSWNVSVYFIVSLMRK